MTGATGERHRRQRTSRGPTRPARSALMHCPTTTGGEGALDLLRVTLPSRGDALVVFSSRDAAQYAALCGVFAGSGATRVCSGGELVSLLFGPYRDVEWVLLDPLHGGSPEGTTDEARLIDRERFVDRLLGRSASAAHN